MNWKDEGNHYTTTGYPGLRCYKRVGGRGMTTAEYESVLCGKSPTFRFESSKKPGTFFDALLQLTPDRRTIRYLFPDRESRPKESRPSAVAATSSTTPLKVTPPVHQELDWLRSSMQTTGLHAITMVLIPYRMIAPNNPSVKEAAHVCPVGVLELEIAEDLTNEIASRISKRIQPRAQALLGLAEKLQTKAYLIVMSPTHSHFWVCNMTDRGSWEKKTSQTLPGFLNLLRRSSA